ncbi:P-loop containing nucleoside triphosphate hydrolase protein [Rhizophagus clarus]|nr:P-loop containing nucleoside triphosphate hydrolase protein [Rhizophagus clarus]
MVNLIEELGYTLKEESNKLEEIPILTKKSFAINGAIRPKEVPFVYFIDPLEHQENNKFLNDIRGHKFLMLMGSRLSGKSTRAYQLIQELHKAGFICLYTSFANVTANEDKNIFWKNLGKSLQRINNNHFRHRKEITSSNDFLDVFAGSEWKKKIVIFIDDFDCLYNATDEVRDDCLNTFRCIKESICDFAICSIVAIGNFNIQYLKTSEMRISPFSIRESFNNSNFSKEQIQALFNDFTQEKSITLDEEIIDDIYLRTNGHPGLVGLCGHLIAENLIEAAKRFGNLNFATWQNYVIKLLYSDIQNFPIFERLKNMLLDQSENTRNAMYFLRSQVFSNSGPYFFKDKDIQFLKLFANEGILRPENRGYMISSPLLHSFILQYIMPNIFKYSPLKKPPFRDDGSVDIFRILKEAVNTFDKNYIKSAAISYKKTAQVTVDRQKDVLIPHENLYQQELAIIITNWLEKWDVISQNHVNTTENEKTNNLNYSLVITAPEKPTAVIGIAATKTLSELNEYFNQTLTYAHSLESKLNVRDIWVIHFTCQDLNNKCPYWPTREQEKAGLNTIHIWHDLKFTEVRISARWKGINGMQEIRDENIEKFE